MLNLSFIIVNAMFIHLQPTQQTSFEFRVIVTGDMFITCGNWRTIAWEDAISPRKSKHPSSKGFESYDCGGVIERSGMNVFYAFISYEDHP